MVGDARVANRAFLRARSRRRNALELAVLVDDGLSRGVIARREKGSRLGARYVVTETRSPMDRRVEPLRTHLHQGIQRDDVAGRLEGESLLDAQSVRGGGFEHDRLWRC